jgi:transposase
MSIFLAKQGFSWYNYPMKPLSDTPIFTVPASHSLGWQIESEITNQLEAMQFQIDEQAALIKQQTVLIKYYENQLLMLKRQRFGISSERAMIDDSQLSLFDAVADETAKTGTELETEVILYTRKKRKGKREEDLSGLPVERIDHMLPGDERGCPECGEVMNDIGVDIRRELKLNPATVTVLEHATHAYACKAPECVEVGGGSPVIVKANAPKPLIPGSLASPSLVAHIAVQKYQNGTPLYRLEKGFEYDGVVVSRQNMANWVIKSVELYLFSIYAMLKSFLLKESALHSDATPIQVLREPGRKAQTKSCERIYRTSGCSDRKIVIYEYTETKGQEHPTKFLEGYRGYLHTDGEPGYHKLPDDIIVVGCWAHLRRYWEKILKFIPEENRKGTDAERGVAFINRLFMLERTFKNLSPEERFKMRLEKSKPVADDFFKWVGYLKA